MKKNLKSFVVKSKGRNRSKLASTKSRNRAIFATRLRFNDTSREHKCEFYASAFRHNQPLVETFVIIEPKHLSRLRYNSKKGASLYFHSRIFSSKISPRSFEEV